MEWGGGSVVGRGKFCAAVVRCGKPHGAVEGSSCEHHGVECPGAGSFMQCGRVADRGHAMEARLDLWTLLVHDFMCLASSIQ